MPALRTTTRFAAALGAAVSFGADFWPPAFLTTAAAEGPAAVSIVCQMVDYGRLTERLAARYGERPVAVGAATDAVIPGGVATVVFASAGGATWTLVHLWPDGAACVAASGEHWETTAAPPSGGMNGPGEES